MPYDANYRSMLEKLQMDMEAQRLKHEMRMQHLSRLKEAQAKGTLTPTQQQEIDQILQRLTQVGFIYEDAGHERRAARE